MSVYYVNSNTQDTGEHEVHKDGCDHMPDIDHKKKLGDFDNCQDALKKAKEYYTNVDGCYYCCYPCHKK
jgi:hypothetical protein